MIPCLELKVKLSQTADSGGGYKLFVLCRQLNRCVVLQGLRGFSYTEVCSPHGTDEGVVIPMGY